MQFLLITKQDTLQSISRIVGAHNIDYVIAENGLKREPKIGIQWNKMCDSVVENQLNPVSAARKSTLLNSVIDSQEVFEKVCLLDEDDWKIFSAFQAFRDAIRVPESIVLPFSSKVIGSLQNEVVGAKIGILKNGVSVAQATGKQSNMSTSRDNALRLANQSEPVSSATYKLVLKELKDTGTIKSEIFNSVNTSAPASSSKTTYSVRGSSQWYSGNIPWGKIMIYSSFSNEGFSIPAYPEQIDTSRSANYTAMGDILYQYEPWIMYESSGPREQSLVFHLHRDMWTGNHLDGNANKLIRFCEANTYPRFSGATVNSPTVKIFVNGTKFIAGVLTRADVSWKGPIGRDGWYLEFELTLTIQEVSDIPLNFDAINRMGLIGG